jgi:hypothetical protein
LLRGAVDRAAGWVVPEVDEVSADGLIIEAVHQSLEAIQRASSDRQGTQQAQMSSSIASVR